MLAVRLLLLLPVLNGGLNMKKSFVLCFFLGINSLAWASEPQILAPESGNRYSCYDEISQYTYHLEIKDMGDETGSVSVFWNGTLVHGPVDADVVFSSDNFLFGFKSQDFEETIGFENYDLNSAEYLDGGDSRPLDCKMLND